MSTNPGYLLQNGGGATGNFVVSSLGKITVAGTNFVAPAAGAGPFAGLSGSVITVSLTGLTLAAQNVSAAITVTTTAVTASSIIRVSGLVYTVGAAGVLAAGWPAVMIITKTAGTSFTFQVANLGTGALSGAIGITFCIDN